MIILASQSPRRHELMKLTGLPFTVRVADIDETMDPALPVQQEVTRVSRRKAQAIAARYGLTLYDVFRRADASPDDIVIAADTIVVIDGRELGKPRSEEEALGMLRLLSGRTHEVVTVLSVCKGSQLESEAVVTKVTFRTLCEEELRAYVRTGEPMDKAGSYGIQGYGAMFVSRIEGDYFSVMGLPLCPLCRMLRAFGVPILDVQEAQA